MTKQKEHLMRAFIAATANTHASLPLGDSRNTDVFAGFVLASLPDNHSLLSVPPTKGIVNCFMKLLLAEAMSTLTDTLEDITKEIEEHHED